MCDNNPNTHQTLDTLKKYTQTINREIDCVYIETNEIIHSKEKDIIDEIIQGKSNKNTIMLQREIQIEISSKYKDTKIHQGIHTLEQNS